ncbi:MAG: heme-dependent oxidative N-demethylase subunit alpha family protein [Opitutales bacterium]
MTGLRALFPAEDFRFRLTLRTGEPGAFFRTQDHSGNLLRERAHWLAQDPAKYAALQSEGRAAFDELIQEAPGWGLPAAADCLQLGRTWEPDVLLLTADASGEFRLRGGALCFPTGWALAEKVGRTLDEIHGVVPGLNPAIGGAIRQFIGRLRSGTAFHRDNWGIAATGELNLHPTRRLAPPGLPVRLDRLWLRVEHQALVALPRSGGVLFGIRLALHRLDEVAADRDVAVGLRHALLTMPPELAAYKRLAEIRQPLADRLAG